MAELPPVGDQEKIGKYTKAIKDAGCEIDAGYGGLTLKDDIFSVEGCHTIQAYEGLAVAAFEDVKHGLDAVADSASQTYKHVRDAISRQK